MVQPSWYAYYMNNSQYCMNWVKNNTNWAYASNGVRIGSPVCVLWPPSCHVCCSGQHFAIALFSYNISLIHGVIDCYTVAEVYQTIIPTHGKHFDVFRMHMSHDISSTRTPSRSDFDQISHARKVLEEWFSPRGTHITWTMANIAWTESRTIPTEPTLVMAWESGHRSAFYGHHRATFVAPANILR